jgi:hypothetical protein
MAQQKTTRRLSCAYLYSDGTLIQLFDENRDDGAKPTEAAA